MNQDKHILSSNTISTDHPCRQFAIAIEQGRMSVGEAIDAVFTADSWKRFTDHQKQELMQNFFAKVNDPQQLASLTQGERFLLLYGGLKAEALLFHLEDANTEVRQRVLATVLSFFDEADGKSSIMARAYYLAAEEIMTACSDEPGGSEMLAAVAMLERGIAALPDDPKPELLIDLFSLSGGAKEALASWLRRASPEQLREMGSDISIPPLVADAVICFKAALTFCDPEKHLPIYALTLIQLGNVLLFDSPVPQDRLEEALTVSEKAIALPEDAVSPPFRGMAYHNLGMIYHERSRGDRAENIRTSIRYYEKALLYRTRETDPYAWSTTQSNLGNSYSDRPDHDIEENDLAAIRCFENALQVRTRDEYPYDWAFTIRSMGTIYAERGIDRGSGDDLKKARSCLDNALNVLTSDVHPTEWGGTMSTLGIINAELYSVEHDRQNLDRALSCLRAALPVVEKANPVEYVRSLATMIDLSLATNDPGLECSMRETASLLEQRIGSSEISRENRAHGQLILAKYYRRLAKVKPATPGASSKAIGFLVEAAGIYAQMRRYERLLSTNWLLAQLYKEEGDPEKMLEVLEASLDVIERRSRSKVVEEAQSYEVREHLGFYLKLFQLYMDRNMPLRALSTADRAKSRAMLSTGQPDVPLPADPVARQRIGEYRELLAKQRRLQALLSKSTAVRRSRISLNRYWAGPDAMEPAMRELNEQLDEVELGLAEGRREIEAVCPEYAATVFGSYFPDLSRFFRAHRDIGILTFQHAPTGTYAFYIHPGDADGGFKIEHELLDRRQLASLNELVNGWFERYNQVSTQRKQGVLRDDHLVAAMMTDVAADMKKMLIAYGELLGPSLIRHFIQRNVKHLLFVTYRDNHVIPFAAIPIPRRLLPEVGCLVEAFTSVSTVPSFSMVERLECLQDQGTCRLVVGKYNPPDAYLPHCDWEMRSVLSFFPDASDSWNGSSDSVSNLARMAEQANILHLSAHGMTVVSDYHKSQLRLGESVALTYSDIMDRFHLQQNCVAILSACEAGYSPSRMKRAAWDEYVGLDGAFVQAGARAVVSSVWMAYDRPTALLMYLLHRNLKMGAGSATALAEAQRSLLRGTWRTDRTVEEFNRFHAKQPDVPPLRASEDFSAPIFWAGFKHLGIPRKQ